ncbi:AhpC/TSA family protein [Flavobacterium salilacus subsp. salilacus]|uniref:peroxiredoxin family protein n=1 Tax=Flavobacterium TaxID=237 RepID=UPI00107535D5|nr:MULTISPECIES: peroxiredoxin family protein [Flavobacterium]KAF2519987.1 AhpC/TSA family protein [Flavobacterium salilacus subsp. salilacus]MBE1614099.1 AhpC/TSA family protein [Flavobacterium sp. SaA2.13]
MKKAIFVFAIAAVLFTSCKSEKEKVAEEETIVAEEEVAVADEKPDYVGFGMEEDDLPQGLKVGDKVPDVVMMTDDNKEVNLKDLYSDQPVVVLFYRAYWCPVCTQHLLELAKRAKEIEDKGVKLVAITPETYENVAKTKDDTGANFTIISDADGKIMNAFDVDFKVRNDYQDMIEKKLSASVAKTNASGEAVLPVPATYIIDTDGKIVYRQFNPNYRERASVQEILDNLPSTK